jgi:hypothetical protein
MKIHSASRLNVNLKFGNKNLLSRKQKLEEIKKDSGKIQNLKSEI